jgi:DNA repair exonuclease SbcCD nuclease subunit
MKNICCISDCHLGYMHRMKKERLNHYETAFTEAIDKAMKYEPTILFFVGDIFHHTKPDPRSLRIFVNTLISIADKTSIVLCVGNHELEGNLASTYIPMLSDLHENIHVLTTDDPHVGIKVDGKLIGVHGFQFLRGKETAEGALRKISSDLLIDGEKPDTNILCMHQAIEGYLSPHEISLKCLRDASQKYDLLILGHVHKNQRIAEIEAPAYYIGSTERVSFNEAENKTGFVLFQDFDFKNPVFIETDSSSMKRIKQDLGHKTAQEINEIVKGLILENKDSKCLQIELEAELDGDYFDLCTEWHSIYPEYTILSVNITQKIRNESIRLEKTFVDEKTFEEFFEKKGMKDRGELKELCMKYYEKYGN